MRLPQDAFRSSARARRAATSRNETDAAVECRPSRDDVSLAEGLHFANEANMLKKGAATEGKRRDGR